MKNAAATEARISAVLKLPAGARSSIAMLIYLTTGGVSKV
jgi:hypothetical protein